jgi:tRNA/tmRNA/rRNA uracil-C5-methylase (TrmA/RlmC/RlmD family)
MSAWSLSGDSPGRSPPSRNLRGLPRSPIPASKEWCAYWHPGRGARATIVDADPEAISCGSEAALSLRLAEAAFERADVLEFLGRRTDGGTPDLVIADPPRTGLGRGVAQRLAAIRASRIVMVSCDPATLARDLAALVASGYRIEQITPFDLFPQTAHVEAVAWLSLAR